MIETCNVFFKGREPLPGSVRLGYESDNNVRRIAFYLPRISETQTASLVFGGKYANAVTLAEREGTYVVDLSAEIIGGAGSVEGVVTINGPEGEIWHSAPIDLVTGDLPDVETDVETRYPGAVEQMLTEIAKHKTEMDAAVERAEAAADRAESAGGGGGSGGGGITQETDPTVPAWAKQPQKPTYTADEVGALAADAPVVRYDAQELTEEQQTQARENVGAQPKGDYALKTDIPELYDLPTASATVKGGVKVGKGLEMDGEALAVKGPEKFELIEKIVLEEDMTAIERTQEPDGTPYSFSKIGVKLLFKAANAPQSVNYKFNNSMSYVLTSSNGIDTMNMYSIVYATTENGAFHGYATWGNGSEYAAISMMSLAQYRFLRPIEKLTALHISPIDSTSAKMSAGSVIEIYGVRA